MSNSFTKLQSQFLESLMTQDAPSVTSQGTFLKDSHRNFFTDKYTNHQFSHLNCSEIRIRKKRIKGE